LREADREVGRVEVTASATPLQTTEAQQVSTLNDAQVHDLPVSRYDWSNLTALSAGTTKAPFNNNNGSGIVINGLPSAGYNFTVDGTNAGNNVNFIFVSSVTRIVVPFQTTLWHANKFNPEAEMPN
jgi:hypothetical protein